MKNAKILVIDDDPVAFAPFKAAVKDLSDVELILAASCEEGLEKFSESPFSYALAFVDYQYKESGEEEAKGHLTAKKLRHRNPCIPLYVISGDYSTGALKDWQKENLKFLYKPITAEQVKALVLNALEGFEEEKNHLEGEKDEHIWLRELALKKIQMDFGIAGVSPNIRATLKKALICSNVNESVFLDGETGTGKELIAKAIHHNSPRSDGPFVAINCASITDTVFESEVFGHVKGAFTGATMDYKGAAKSAHGGTLFLDEIHHLPMQQQAKLLRFAQDKLVKPVGSTKSFPVDTRIICAGHANDEKIMIDLYNRVAAIDIRLAPLRERPEDIVPITKFIKRSVENEHDRKKTFHSSTLDLMKKYQWRGNVRELHRLVKKLCLMVEDDILLPRHLPKTIQKPTSFPYIEDDVFNWNELLAIHEREKLALISKAMEKTNGKQTAAAELLGVRRTTMLDHLEKQGINKLSRPEKLSFFKKIANMNLRGGLSYE